MNLKNNFHDTAGQKLKKKENKIHENSFTV